MKSQKLPKTNTSLAKSSVEYEAFIQTYLHLLTYVYSSLMAYVDLLYVSNHSDLIQ